MKNDQINFFNNKILFYWNLSSLFCRFHQICRISTQEISFLSAHEIVYLSGHHIDLKYESLM